MHPMGIRDKSALHRIVHYVFECWYKHSASAIPGNFYKSCTNAGFGKCTIADRPILLGALQ